MWQAIPRAAACSAIAFLASCGGSSGTGDPNVSDSGTPQNEGGLIFVAADALSPSPFPTVPSQPLPVGFGPRQPAKTGAFSLGPEVDVSKPIELGTSGGCTDVIYGLVRDFRRGDRPGGHPDFEIYAGSGLEGLVQPELGADRKPIYAHPGPTAHTAGPDAFAKWYREVPTENRPFAVAFHLVQTGKVFTFESDSFFPLDGQGYGNEDLQHNYHFTTEIQTRFTYHGGETFSFTGDDDLWVFINRRLAIDLGGLHGQMSKAVSLDQDAARLGIVPGQTYELALFHAERHTSQSNFRIDTTMEFVECSLPPIGPLL